MKSLFKSTGLSAVLLGSGSGVCDMVKPWAEDKAVVSSVRSCVIMVPSAWGKRFKGQVCRRTLLF